MSLVSRREKFKRSFVNLWTSVAPSGFSFILRSTFLPAALGGLLSNNDAGDVGGDSNGMDWHWAQNGWSLESASIRDSMEGWIWIAHRYW